MNKAEFVDLVQKHGEFENKEIAQKAVKAFTDAITEALVNKDSVSLIGFGTFLTVEVAEKKGKVPGTKKDYLKPAHTAPKFKVGKNLKDAVAGDI